MNPIKKDIYLVSPGSNDLFIKQNGEKEPPPVGWAFQPAGDAGITRRITANGKYWRVQIKKGKRTVSKGIWAPAKTIKQAQEEMTIIRQSEAYKKKQQTALAYREKRQSAYEGKFCCAVEEFLNFHSAHKSTEKKMAKAVTAHAIPIGSGTVARTSLIPMEERAARAVIAWMRHNTTAYDKLQIKRIKGERHRVRRLLAQHSFVLLSKYRQGLPIDVNCSLIKALR